jgi:purine nucleosidase
MSPTRIILDTDCGMGAGADIDDGFAIALAHADPSIQLDMITTVNGNVDVESATILTGILLDQLKVPNIPFYRGASTPFIHPERVRIPRPHVSRLRDKARKPNPGYAAVAIVEHIMAHPGEITIVAIGPLTNIAMAITLEPRIKLAVKEIVMMGGVFFGNMSSFDMPGEFNVFTDPEAAHTVLKSGIPQRWVGLDVTLKVRITMDDANNLISSSSPFARFAGEATKKYIEYEDGRYSKGPPVTSVPLHDPLAVAVITRPDLCEWKEVAVNVICGDSPARGVILCDRLEQPNPPVSNCRVACEVDAKGFTKHFMDLIKSL